MSKWSQLGGNYRAQLENWVIWTRKDTGKPSGYESFMSKLFKSAPSCQSDDTTPLEPIRIVCELDAQHFDKLVMTLSPHQREIFKIEVLDIKRKPHGFRYVRWADMSRKYSLIGMTRSTYERRLVTIEQDLKRRGELV